jgi:hypothetical protein
MSAEHAGEVDTASCPLTAAATASASRTSTRSVDLVVEPLDEPMKPRPPVRTLTMGRCRDRPSPISIDAPNTQPLDDRKSR